MITQEITNQPNTTGKRRDRPTGSANANANATHCATDRVGFPSTGAAEHW